MVDMSRIQLNLEITPIVQQIVQSFFESRPVEGSSLRVIDIVLGYERAKNRLQSVVDNHLAADGSDDIFNPPMVNAKQILDLMKSDGLWSTSFDNTPTGDTNG